MSPSSRSWPLKSNRDTGQNSGRPRTPTAGALYGRCSVESRSVNGMSQDDPRRLKVASSVATDLALFERQAKATVALAQGRSQGRFGYGPLPVTCPTAR
jgi:hypothetical protein